VKTLALIVRRPDLSRAAFRAHYEAVHAPLATPLLSGLLRYVRHHVLGEIHGAPPFDVVTSFVYRDAAAARAVMARVAGPEAEALRQDELTFMDKPRNTFFAVREEGERGARAAPADFQAVVLVKGGPARLSPPREAVRGLAWELCNESLPQFGAPPFDRVWQLHAAADDGLAAWGARAAGQGAGVCIVRVSEDETPIPPGGVA
jgi:uncharacterized protein (TIGR02118 family)